MTSIDEKIKNFKRGALEKFCAEDIWKKLPYAKWEQVYLKELQEQKAMEEKDERKTR